LTVGPTELSQSVSPDDNAIGFVQYALDPLRYGGQGPDPHEVGGITISMIPQSVRVLDVGCGTGSITELVRDVCHADIVGIEPDEVRANLAKSRGLDVRIGYLNRGLIQELGPFDVVLFGDVLEHVPDPYKMLSLSREALKPTGVVIISVPNVAHWSVRLNLLRGKFQYQPSGIMDATHLRWFTVATAKSLIASAGLKVTAYRATAGIGLHDGLHRRLLFWLPNSFRIRLLQSATMRWPTIFGSQHIFKAEML
jgi:methionine biosynthesis protein MetW